MRILRKQLAGIVTHVDRPALRTDIVTAGGLGCAGDLVCQTAVEGESIDWRRFFAVSSFEALYMGGMFHFFCQAFPLVVCAAGRQLPAGSWLGGRLQATSSGAHAFGCAIADNIHDGALMIPSYFIGVGLLQGDSFAQAMTNLRAEWLNSYLIGEIVPQEAQPKPHGTRPHPSPRCLLRAPPPSLRVSRLHFLGLSQARASGCP